MVCIGTIFSSYVHKESHAIINLVIIFNVYSFSACFSINLYSNRQFIIELMTEKNHLY
jgi:hypothetical protein